MITFVVINDWFSKFAKNQAIENFKNEKDNVVKRALKYIAAMTVVLGFITFIIFQAYTFVNYAIFEFGDTLIRLVEVPEVSEALVSEKLASFETGMATYESHGSLYQLAYFVDYMVDNFGFFFENFFRHNLLMVLGFIIMTDVIVGVIGLISTFFGFGIVLYHFFKNIKYLYGIKKPEEVEKPNDELIRENERLKIKLEQLETEKIKEIKIEEKVN